MPRLSYETAETLIYDPIAAHRNATRAVLYTLGFRNIGICSKLDALNQAIKRAPPDLVLCEAQGADVALCEIIQTLRQGSGGHPNPFLVIIVTAWEKNQALVHRVINSGADDLVLRPFSTALLGARIEAHTERRKSFVITHDYVGPDRRGDQSRPSNTDLFDPPNSLKMKAKDGLSANEVVQRLQTELRSAKDTLAIEKLRRDTFQVCVLWRLLQDPTDPMALGHLEKLKLLIESVAKRCREQEIEAALQWCDSVLAAVDGLIFGIDRNASMHLLGQGAINLNQIVNPSQARADHLRNLEEIVAKIKAREGAAAESRPLESAAAG